MMKNYVTRTTAECKEDLDKRVARFIYAANVQFKGVEEKEFVHLIEGLRPGYKPPNRKAIAGRLLDTIHEEVLDEMKGKISMKDTLVLTQDGWSSVQNDPIIAHSFFDGEKNHLLNLKDSGTNKKDADYCFELLDEAIQEIQRDLNKQVFGVCTDNEAKMVKLRQLVRKKYPNMIVYGCGAHYLNLLQGDVENPAVLKHIIQIQKHFRNVHAAHGQLKEKGGCQPQLPNDTRWNSNVDCLDTFIRNQPIYIEIKSEMLRNNQDMPAQISQKVDDVGLLREAENLLSHMRTFGNALDRLQSDKCHLSDAVSVWINLLDDKVNIHRKIFHLKDFKIS